jgi:adenylylsulfate kinase
MPNIERHFPCKAFVVWFTGLPGAGKTTLAALLKDELRQRDIPVELLDGDVLRHSLCSDLGFSREDRVRNVQRIGFLCDLLTKHGIVSIVAAISPYRESRTELRTQVQPFIEVFVDCPYEVRRKRDPKGHYLKALRGEIRNFTGITDEYEPPLTPELTIHTEAETPRESLTKLVNFLESCGFLAPRTGPLKTHIRSVLYGNA